MIVAKWGGSLLTNKGSRGSPRVRARTLARLAREWDGTRGVLVHGAGSFGHPAALRLDLGRRRLGRAASERALREVGGSVRLLQRQVVDALRRAGVPAVPLPAALVAEARGGRVRLLAHVFAACLQAGCVPVTGGDVVRDDRLGVRVLSGDEILEHLARALRPRRVVFASDVEGVLVEGQPVAGVSAASGPALLRSIAGGSDATGGMRGKVRCALRIQRMGVEAWIVDGSRPGVFRAALGPRARGTRFVASRAV